MCVRRYYDSLNKYKSQNRNTDRGTRKTRNIHTLARTHTHKHEINEMNGSTRKTTTMIQLKLRDFCVIMDACALCSVINFFRFSFHFTDISFRFKNLNFSFSLSRNHISQRRHRRSTVNGKSNRRWRCDTYICESLSLDIYLCWIIAMDGDKKHGELEKKNNIRFQSVGRWLSSLGSSIDCGRRISLSSPRIHLWNIHIHTD